MEPKESDIFELSEKMRTPNFEQDFLINDENPFFSNAFPQENSRRLNDYDSNILQDGAYKDIDDDLFKLEYKISKTEEEIRNLKSQITTAQEINDTNNINLLHNKLNALNDEYQELLRIYNKKAISGKITDSFSNLVKKSIGSKFSGLQSSLSNVLDLAVAKLPKQIASVFKIRKSLHILENINKSVDKLVTMTVPYGENIDRYQQLSKYIIKANSIHSEIAGYLKK